MDEPTSPVRRFWRKYRRWIVIGLIVYVVGTLLLIGGFLLIKALR